MSAKHTPGPWEAVSNLVRTVRNPDGSGGFLVAECPANVGARVEDARLIAAAPDLLAALSALADVGNDFSDWHPKYGRAIEMVRAAIAKATGEQQ